MQEQTGAQELKDRLDLIENMLAAGRRQTESWGWTFLLWGVAYYVAIAWATWGRSNLAWPVTMIAAAVVTGIVAVSKRSGKPQTTIGNSIGAIWTALGISMFLLFFSLGFSHRIELHVFIAIICAMLGMANATSGMILKWKMQLVCAVVWWTASVAGCFGDKNQSIIVLLAAIFFCQIVFGIYAMVRGTKRQHGAIHA